MFYPTYKCKNCAIIETDYEKGYKYLFHYDIDSTKPNQKTHICVDVGECKTIGIMELIGFYEKIDNV